MCTKSRTVGNNKTNNAWALGVTLRNFKPKRSMSPSASPRVTLTSRVCHSSRSPSSPGIACYYRELMPVCGSVCLCVCLSVCVHDNSKNNGSADLKLEHIVVYENSSDKFDIGHCPIKVKVMA